MRLSLFGLMFWPSVPYQTIPDCIRYIIGVFCYNHRRTFFLHSNTLDGVKTIAHISHAQEFTLIIHCTESLRHSNVYKFYL